jgi:hypothetical protein
MGAPAPTPRRYNPRYSELRELLSQSIYQRLPNGRTIGEQRLIDEAEAPEKARIWRHRQLIESQSPLYGGRMENLIKNNAATREEIQKWKEQKANYKPKEFLTNLAGYVNPKRSFQEIIEPEDTKKRPPEDTKKRPPRTLYW